MPMILNEEQNMLKDSAKDFCSNNAPIAQLRKLRDDDNADGFDRGTWKSMVELGWSSIPWAEEHGGLAFGYKGLGVVTEETGRTLAASPMFATVWVGGTAINVGGSDAQKAELLPKMAGGELLLALALEESHRHSPYGVATKAVRIRWQVAAHRREDLRARWARGRQADRGGAYRRQGRVIGTASRCFWWIAKRKAWRSPAPAWRIRAMRPT